MLIKRWWNILNLCANYFISKMHDWKWVLKNELLDNGDETRAERYFS